jgi:hypothetical protein
MLTPLLHSLTQGSITSWRANCASFASLGALGKLQQLSLHAFHCPGAHLAAALMQLTALSELRLSGRVVLEPLAGLSRLTRLQVRFILLILDGNRVPISCTDRQADVIVLLAGLSRLARLLVCLLSV